jgi:hypothetical protein
MPVKGRLYAGKGFPEGPDRMRYYPPGESQFWIDVAINARLKLLLDTHVWLWTLHDPSRLSHRVRDVLRNPPTMLIAQQLPLPPCDPADQFLAATAQLMDLTLGHGGRQSPSPGNNPDDEELIGGPD